MFFEWALISASLGVVIVLLSMFRKGAEASEQ